MDHLCPDITELLAGLQIGDPRAEERLIARIYGDLRRMAARYMRRERLDHTLQPTALVHEAYLRLVEQREKKWQNRAHFFGVAAHVMRRILVDYARSRGTAKRGGALRRLGPDDIPCVWTHRAEELIALDKALSQLAEIDPRQSRIVELRFFVGLTEEEIGGVLGTTSRTVKRDWRLAKAWLHAELST